MYNIKNVKQIAVYRAGLLGDTLVAVPALWCLRNAYPEAKIIYIWQNTNDNMHVSSVEVLKDTGLVDEFISDELNNSHFKRIFTFIKIWWYLRKKRLDIGINLEEPHWSKKRNLFLKACGARIVLGPTGKGKQIERDTLGKLIRIKHISDSLIDVLRPLKINVPGPLSAQMDLPRSDNEIRAVNLWLADKGLTYNNGRWVAISCWSNMPLKRWPLENYMAVIKELMQEFDIIPFFLGGPNEKEVAYKLVKELNSGYVVAGQLNIKEGIELLSRCKMYLGNDTGTMHMAVAAGIPCVAVFTARDMPGRWDPYGKMHTVFRSDIDCAGCMLRECYTEEMKCIVSIKKEEVLDACRRILNSSERTVMSPVGSQRGTKTCT